MGKLRKYGELPFRAALIHGGPGAAGEMIPVAKELSRTMDVLEPFQTKNTIEGQLDELKSVLEENTDLPITLIGYSWGAWLSLILAAKYPKLIKKLILVSSGPFESEYASEIMQIRLSRMSESDKKQVESFVEDLEKQDLKDIDINFVKIGKLISKADTYDSVESHDNDIIYSYEIFQSVWKQAEQLRKSGELLEYAMMVQCPVTAIHGDYDPHPYKGVEEPLSRYIEDFYFILLKNCGHKPWTEKYAKDEFYKILKQEL